MDLTRQLIATVSHLGDPMPLVLLGDEDKKKKQIQ